MLLDPRRSSAPAIIDPVSGASLSTGDLLDEGSEILAPLDRRRDLLFLLARNDRFTVATYAAGLLDGHAVALVDGQAPTALTASIAMAYGPRWIAGPPGLAGELATAGVPIDETRAAGAGEVVRTGYQPPLLHPDLAVLLTTSGTTGSRKLVRLSAANVASNAASIVEYLGLTPDERPITSLPLHYSFGLSVLNSHWMSGAAVVLSADSVLQPSFWEAVRTTGATSLAGVPFTYQMLERIGFRTMDVPSIRTLQQAGGALDRRLAQLYGEHMAACGGRFFVMYGQTEATARIAYVPPDRLAEKIGSAGIAIPNGRISIEGADGEDVGEVVYEGPNVMLGYASERADLAVGDELGGVLRTGDLGFQDGEGYLFLVGRSKRIAKVFGLRVNLDEVEATLKEHGPVAVVGTDDAIWAFCGFGTEESLRQTASEMARGYRLHPSAIHLQRVEMIPTTGSGKTDYREVERWIPT
jgi:acyl-CoA synthetase (AMP-forming)/AMP-acid ligase II